MTTPQPAAQEVAVRAAEMAQRTGGRVIGVIENMAGEIFGSRRRCGARGREVGAPLLGSVELDPRLREAADLGEPLVDADPESEPTARAIVAVADASPPRGAESASSLPIVA